MVVASEWVSGDNDHKSLVAQLTFTIESQIPDKITDMSNPTSNGGDHDISNYPKALLVCRQNSHPFQERNLNLSQAIKIGRSVARDRVTGTNAMFECKVLSRNHALLWFDNGKFFLQDTKSSNGTFVNNQRLSLEGSQSQPQELCSGDIVQFGVDVIQYSLKNQVTHGCIVATIKLYLPDGEEAKTTQIANHIPNQPTNTVNAIELYQLNQYIQEATVREQQLEGKLGHLQHIVEATKTSAQQAWQALLQEDLLLTRIHVLETQLQVFSANASEDVLRSEMSRLLSDKLSYQQSVEQALRGANEQGAAETQRCVELEQALAGTERDRELTARELDRVQGELQEVTSQLCQCQSRISSLSSQCCRLNEVESQLSSLRVQLGEARHNEAMSRTRLLCKQAELACKTGVWNCNNVKNTKSEGDIIDNKSYQQQQQTCNHESLLLKMELQMDNLQRRLAELNASCREHDIDSELLLLKNQNSDNSLFESNDNHSDVTVLDHCQSISYESTRQLQQDDNYNVNENNVNVEREPQPQYIVQQVATALRELRMQRELLELFTSSQQQQSNNISEQPHDSTEVSAQTLVDYDALLELQMENERLQDIVNVNQQQVNSYEQRLEELQQKLETAGLELQTRPSHESLQSKENVCVNQKTTIDLLNTELSDLRATLTQDETTLSVLQNQIDSLVCNVNDLENIILRLQESILTKDECINKLREELVIAQHNRDQICEIVNEDSFVQTETPTKTEQTETPTQTAKQEVVDFENCIQKDFDFLNEVDTELKEEIVELKEKFMETSHENLRLLSNIEKLETEYNNAVRHSRTMMFVYVAPLLALLCYLLLTPYMTPM